MEETNKISSWIKKNLHLVGAILGLLIFLGFALPIFSSKPITYEVMGDVIELGKLSRRNFWIDEILFGGNSSSLLVSFLVLYLLSLCGSIFCFFGKKNGKFYEVSLTIFIVVGILFLTSNVLFDWNRCLVSLKGYYFLDYFDSWRALASTRLDGGAIISCIFAFLAAMVSLSGAYENRQFKLRDLMEIAILSALAIILDVIQHFIPSLGATGGSIGIALLPLFYLSLRHGPLAGFLSGGIVYGLITCLTDGYGIFLYPLDYLVGFGSVAILGFFKPLIFGKNQTSYNFKGMLFIFIGCLLSTLVRFIGSSLSSIINYGLNLVGALAYNVIYVFASGLICAVILLALYGPLLKLQKAFPPSKSN